MKKTAYAKLHTDKRGAQAPEGLSLIGKLLFTALILLLFITLISTKSSAATARVIDEDNFLGESLSALETAIYNAEEECGIPIRVYLYDADEVVFSYSEGQLLSSFGMTEHDNLILLVITREYSTYYYELFTYGEGYDLISDSAADRILDDYGVYAIKRGDLRGGITSFADIAAEEVIAGREEERVISVTVPIILGLVAGGVALGVVFYRYKRKLKSPIYPLSNYARLDLTVARDDFVTSYVSRVRINTSSGGRSGGGRGGSRGRR